MTKIFKYSVLKYRPSYLLGEQVNIGLLFFFLEDKKVLFLHPKKLRRLTQFYPEANLSIIKKYLAAFDRKANKIDLPRDLVNFDVFIENNFLAKDANSFYFTTAKSGSGTHFKKIIDYYNQLYFSVYDDKNTRSKKDEAYLKNTFKSNLTSQLLGDKEKLALFRHNPSVKNKISNTNFDLAWQNGTTNLIKFLSFDLMEKGTFQEKSFRWFGELSQLESIAQKQNLKIDLVLTKPQNKQLFSSYDNAIRVLEDIPTPKKIIEESNITSYISKAIGSVKPLTNDYLFK